MASLIHCSYSSAARRAFISMDLEELLEKVHRINAGLGVTGMLLHVEDNFLQLPEGDENLVDALHARVAADSRHDHPIRIVREHIADRSFREWRMGYVQATRKGRAGLSSLTAFASDCVFAQIDAVGTNQLVSTLASQPRRSRLSAQTDPGVVAH